jgi:hypothetical protein
MGAIGYWYCSACCNNPAIVYDFRKFKSYGHRELDVCVFCHENLYSKLIFDAFELKLE